MLRSLRAVMLFIFSAGASVIVAPHAAAASQLLQLPIKLVGVDNREVIEADGTKRLKLTGCFAALNGAPINLNGCRSDYVVFGCDGSAGISKSAGQQAYSAAQLAFAMAKPLKMRVYDNVIIDGICWAANAQVSE